MNDVGACLYAGSVMHSRLRPFRHRFRYAVCSLFIDLDRLAELSSRLRLLGIDRRGIFSFWQKDHGAGEDRSLREWVDETLARHGLPAERGRVRLLCFPRLFGYAFNPLSIFFCEGADGRLRALIYQVNNTFGERHFYVHAVGQGDGEGPVRHDCEKAFHVSPFIGMNSTYRFRVSQPDDRLRLLIRQSVPEGQQLVASMSGHRVLLSDAVLARLALTAPLAGFKVVAAIHWQALQLWLKGARYHPHPGRTTEAGAPQAAP